MVEPPRKRTIWLVVAAAVLLLGAVAVAAAVVGHSGPSADGPLTCRECASIASSVPLDVGKTGTYGIVVVRNLGSKTAVLDRIAYRRLTPGLETLPALALRVGDYRGPGLVSGLALSFPPPGAAGVAKRLPGFPVEPHRTQKDDVEVLLGFRPQHQGVFTYDAVDVYYHVEKRRFVSTYPVALKVCAPAAPFLSGRRKCEAHALP